MGILLNVLWCINYDKIEYNVVNIGYICFDYRLVEIDKKLDCIK